MFFLWGKISNQLQRMKEETIEKKKDSSDSFKTTNTMRMKSKAISRCIISILKIFRLCGCGKKRQKGK